MKRIIYPIFALLLTVTACAIPSTPAPTETPIVTEPPEPTEPPVNVTTCNELSLLLDPALASGYDCERIPESDLELEVYPEHTRLTLQGYPLSDKFFEPHISVYPVQRYSELQPDFVAERLDSLQALIGGGPAPVFGGSFGIPLPFLPVFNAGQVFFANYQVVPFVNGSGIRYLTEYAQYYAPVNNNDLFYTYQGLTSNGQYWISIILPINHPMLPADATNPPDDMTWDEFSNSYETYIGDMVNQLNAQAPDSFVPSLTALDALVSGITIQP